MFKPKNPAIQINNGSFMVLPWKRYVLIGCFAALAVLMSLSEGDAQEAKKLCVTSPRANLRAGPGKENRITWEVNQFMPLVEIARQKDWVRVKDVDGDIHWIYKTLISDKVDCLTIKASKANIRKRPTAKAPLWFTVEKYTSFKRVGQQPKWIKLEYEGEIMWVFHTLVWPK